MFILEDEADEVLEKEASNPVANVSSATRNSNVDVEVVDECEIVEESAEIKIPKETPEKK